MVGIFWRDGSSDLPAWAGGEAAQHRPVRAEERQRRSDCRHPSVIAWGLQRAGGPAQGLQRLQRPMLPARFRLSIAGGRAGSSRRRRMTDDSAVRRAAVGKRRRRRKKESVAAAATSGGRPVSRREG